VSGLRPNEPCWCGSGRKYKRCHEPKDRLAALAGGGPGSVGAAVAAGRPQERLVRKGQVTPVRRMPAEIPKPDYATTGKPRMKPPPPIKYYHYPKAICTSVNEVICHGIPDSRALEDGDIVNVDVTVYVDGFHGDCSQTLLVGDVDEASRRLVTVTRQCLYAGIGAVRPGAQVRDIGRAIQTLAEQHGYGVVRAFVGHGIGETFHMEPQVHHYYDPAARFTLKAGMTFTIEPMINMGTWRHSTWDDGWTAVTADLQRSAQFEHTVLVTEGGVEVLTLPDGEPQPFP